MGSLSLLPEIMLKIQENLKRKRQKRMYALENKAREREVEEQSNEHETHTAQNRIKYRFKILQ